jgi:NADH:ubiquinone oxidoreductase subunit 6 (subunit J)
VLNAAFIGVVYQIVNQNKGYTYPGLLIYAVAAFTFFSITTAIVNVVKYRKMNSPAITAVKVLCLAKALVMMFALQSAMFASFGGESEIFERVMNSAFGGVVCFSIFAMAVMMVAGATKKLKALRVNNSETKCKQFTNKLGLC